MKFPLVIILLLSLSGCSHSIAAFSDFTQADRLHDIRKVGVLPFLNESGRRGAGETVTNIFITMLFKSEMFQVEEKGSIERFLIRNKLKALKKIDQSRLKKLGEWLNLDAVFIGIVEEFAGGDQGKNLRTPVVSMRVRLIDTKNGKTLWMTSHRKTGDDYVKIFDVGQVRSVTTLAKLVVSEAIETMM